MSWGEQVFRYCERGQDAAFWAEPFNALSNAGFVVVAAIAATRLHRVHDTRTDRTGRTAVAALIALAVLIGLGSFLFHTFATRWSRLADVAPIGAFMLAYLAFALHQFLGWTWTRIAAALAIFLAATAIAATLSCPSQLSAVTTFAREPCLKGTMGYAPALAALTLTGALLRRAHPAGRALLIAAGLFLAAMLLRWIDMRSCGWTTLLGRPRGTHALWHLLNAATLHVLLGAAIANLRARHAG